MVLDFGKGGEGVRVDGNVMVVVVVVHTPTDFIFEEPASDKLYE
jgi:hypothetical protein